jgi:hypothetical protein
MHVKAIMHVNAIMHHVSDPCRIAHEKDEWMTKLIGA